MVEIKELLPGPYTVRVIDPRIAALGIGLPTRSRFVAARDTTSVATLMVPTTESMIADRCVANHQWAVGDSSFTMGRVVTPDGKPVNNAKVTFAREDGRLSRPVDLGSRLFRDRARTACSSSAIRSRRPPT